MLKKFARTSFCALAVLAADVSFAATSQTSDNLIHNFSFESPLIGSGWFGLWDIKADVGARGILSLVFGTRHSGHYGLKLTPNSRNIIDASYYDYGIGQRLPLDTLRGKTILYQGWISAEGGAKALLRMVAVSKDGDVKVRAVQRETQIPANKQLVLVQDLFDVPDQPLSELFLICSVQGTTGAAYFDDITVSQQMASKLSMGQPDPGPGLNSMVFVDFSKTTRRIPQTLYGVNTEYIFNGMGLWNEWTKSADPDILSLTSDLGVSQIRFPGGLYSNFYHWKNGIGPVDQRPDTPITPGRDLTGNKFGTDEALQISDQLGAPLFITVNSHTGTPEEAAEWAQYIKDSGHNASFWEIGNELYFYRNPLDTSGPVWTPESYSDSFLNYAKALRAVDPKNKVAVDVEFNMTMNGCGVVDATGCWADVVLKRTQDQIDYIALHNALAPIMLGDDAGWDVRTVYAGMLAAPLQVKKLLEELSKKIDALSPANASRIRLAMVEWGPFFQSNPQNRFVDHVKTLGSALYAASLMKVMIESPRTEIAHAFTLVDPLTQGWIGPRQGSYIPRAPYYALQFYAKHFGPLLVPTATYTPTYNAFSMGVVPATENVPYLDVVSSKDEDSGTLHVIAINKHFDQPIRAYFQVDAFYAIGHGTAWTLNGSGIDASTGTELPANLIQQGYFGPQAIALPDGRFDKGGPGEIAVTSQPVDIIGSCFVFDFPAHSVTALVLPGYRLQPGQTQGAGCGDDSGSSTNN